MDNLDIITPHDNLADLFADYTSWCCLPHDRRKRSNGECFAKYGCEVPELYIRYKNAIENAEDEATPDPSNIKVQNESFSFYNNIDELIQISRNLSSSPYISIIDPGMKTVDEVEQALYSFTQLNSKNKRLSNDYSWQLWGFSVPDMYKKVLAVINPEYFDLNKSEEESNIKITENSVFSPVTNMYMHKILDNSYVNRYALIAEQLENDSTRPIVFDAIKECYKFDQSILGTVPWFNEKEYAEYNNGESFCLESSIDYYPRLMKLIEEYRKDPNNPEKAEAILKLGWNPNVRINENTIAVARARQAKSLKEDTVNIINFKDLPINNQVPSGQLTPNDLIMRPIYIILEHDKPDLENITPKVYNNIYLALDYNMRRIYNVVNGFKVKDITNIPYGTILTIFVPSSVMIQINRIISKANIENIVIDDIETNNLYNFIGNNIKNPYAPEVKRIWYTSIIVSLMKVLNAYADKTQIDNSWFDSDINKQIKLADTKKVYEVYSGELSQFSDEVARSIAEKTKLIMDNIVINNLTEAVIPEYIRENMSPRQLTREINTLKADIIFDFA